MGFGQAPRMEQLGEHEKNPYVLLARAVLLRAVMDTQLNPEVKGHRAKIEDAIAFLYGPDSEHRDFWKAVAKIG